VNPEAFGAAVIGHLDGAALHLRDDDLQIGRHHRAVTGDRDMRQAGEMGQSAGDRSLMRGGQHLLSNAGASRGLERFSPRSNTPSYTQLAKICSLPPVSALGG